jgi:putative antitoxin of VapBC-like toxin-antitoxin system
MRTTIEIDRDLLEEAVRVNGAATKSVAVRRKSVSLSQVFELGGTRACPYVVD